LSYRPDRDWPSWPSLTGNLTLRPTPPGV